MSSIFRLHQACACDRALNYIKGIGFERVEFLLGNGIIVSGTSWRSQRRIIRSASKRHVIAQISKMMRSTNRNLPAYRGARAASGKKNNYTSATSELVLRVVFKRIWIL